MKNKSFLIASLVLFLPATISAADSKTSGSLELGVRLGDEQDSSSKYQEYRDLENALFGNLLLDHRGDGLDFGIEAYNISRDDQSYLLQGKNYGSYSYELFYDETPHNLTFDAKSFYSGIGSDNLSVNQSVPANPVTWRTFDYGIESKTYGGGLDVSSDSPFFFSIGVDRKDKEGVKPLGSGSFSGQVEMPEPVDYTTDNFTVSGGYKDPLFALNLSAFLSNFDNEYQSVRWFNPFIGRTEVNSLPPDNDYLKFSLNLNWQELPFASTFMVNGSYSNISNDISVDDLGMGTPSGLNQNAFEGDISYTSLSASIVSRPSDSLNTKLYYDYLDKDNDSTVVVYSGGGNKTHLFDYTSNELGFDLNYDLDMHTKLGAGYQLKNIDRRNRPDADSNTDNVLFVKVKNTKVEDMLLKASYSFLNRDTDEDHDLTGVAITDAEYIKKYVQRFDNTSKMKHELKLGMEMYPSDVLDVGLEYVLALNDYQDVTLGRTGDLGHEFYVDMMWHPSNTMNMHGFAGYEMYDADSDHYNYFAGSGFPPQAADPTINDGNPGSYRWSQSLKNNLWTIGLGVETDLVPDTLKLNVLCQYQMSDGKSEFDTQGSSSLSAIDKSDDYDITTLDAKLLYALAANIDLTVGYTYEKASYEDLQYIGYRYNPQGSYLTGAYADHDYETHLGYVAVKYAF